jgi:hypothetical protein
LQAAKVAGLEEELRQLELQLVEEQVHESARSSSQPAH